MAAVFRRGIARQLSSVTKALRSSEEVRTMEEPGECFVGKSDHHAGIHVDSRKEPCRAEKFGSRLRASLPKWTNENKRTVWFKVDRSDSSWIPHLVNEGFYFHHAKENYVTLYRCLSPDVSVPPYAHTNLGVGAFVVNEETNEVLVIKEKHTSLPVNRWKLPGGYVEPGENIPEAAQRELLEETGIKATFKSLVAFRHAHNYAFGCSDIYIVARMVPETLEIKKCDREVSECIWMKLDEYANSPEVHKLNRFIANKMMEYLQNHIEIGLIHGQHPNSTEPIWIYAITDDDNTDLSIVN
ncbi:nudix hydrolase 6 [Diachasma alloeum]|uniref:nudix hydrolase 6 n=1 Tax=Diachasma alloeum TaxID=454923 RepID=UPI0007384515|nr:nudix hydrolase 6 [Diachasma alloeum]